MSGAPLDAFRCELSGMSLIEASAGTGKTWNICALYLRLLLQRRLDVSQILVVTFTNAATAQLRERIRARIEETLEHLKGEAIGAGHDFAVKLLDSLPADPVDGPDRKHLLGQALQRFDEAAIFTIHGYCERALRDTPLGAGMPLSMELLAEEPELATEVAGDFWRRKIATGNLAPGLAAYLVQARDTPEKFAALLERRVAKPLARLEWPGPVVPMEQDGIAARQQEFDAARQCWQQDQATIVACVKTALGSLNGNTYNESSVDLARESWRTLFLATHPLAASRELKKLDLFTSRLLQEKTNKGKAAPAHHRFFDLAQSVLDYHERCHAALWIERAQLLRELLEHGPEALRSSKRARRVMSFDDLLSNLHERLTSGKYPWLAPLLRSRFPAALIDEFQDTDPVQFGIFHEIYSAPHTTLFLVGDPKQAIYSFRNADLRVYLHARSEATRTYTLAENQRCSRELLAALNVLFDGHGQGFMVEGLRYVPLICGNRERKPFVDNSQTRAPLQLWSLPPLEGDMLLPKDQARQRSALASAAEIARLLAAGQRGEITLDGKNLQAGDIAVLVGRHRDGMLMRKALAQVSVGSVELSRISIFKSSEAKETERILAAVLEPTRLPSLRAAYATALLGGDATRLEALRADEGDVLGKMARLADYRDQWLQRGVGVMLRSLIIAEGIIARLLSLPFGERRLTNVLHLVETLHGEETHRGTPEVLLAWLQRRLTQDSQDEATELRLESERNLVQIVTIHRAKGLEYPIVFCPFLWDGSPGRSDGRPYNCEYHDDEGKLVMDFRALPKQEEERIRSENGADRLAERLRMTYVALTRAMHRGYVVVGSYSTRTRNGASSAESRHGALPWLAAGNGMPAAPWRKNQKTPEEIAAAWRALADRAAPDIGYGMLPSGPGLALLAPHASPQSIEILAPPARILPGWRLGSYSQLIHGATGDAAAVDHDLRAFHGEAPDLGMPEAVAAEDIARFPRGMTAGHCIHSIFESVDFVRPEGWSGEIAKALRAHPQTPRPGTTTAQLPGMLMNMVRDVLGTPLAGGFRLAEVPRARRLVELKFSLPASKITHLALRKILEQHGHRMPALNFPELRGYLSGAIDLVIEVADRYWILDWKSNFLGATALHYDTPALEAAMRQHHYHLQYMLYIAALHRYLQRRLPGYSYDLHIGGALYLFVRGVRPGWTNRLGHAAGVYLVRPARTVIEDLSALMYRPREVA